MQPAPSELPEAQVAARSPRPAKVVTLHEDDREKPLHPIVDLVLGVIYWSVLVFGIAVPPIGALYTLLTG